MDFERMTQVFIYQGMILVVFLFLSYKSLARGRKKIHLYLSLFYIFGAIGIILNMIYAFIFIEFITELLTYFTNFSICIAPIFLLLLNLILLKSEAAMNEKKQFLIIITYGAILSLMFLFIPLDGIQNNPSTNWYPKWSLSYLIFIYLVLTIITTIPIFYTSIKLYHIFEDPELKKRWLYFVIGYCGLAIYLYSTFLGNYISNLLTYILISIGIASIIPSILLLYYGIGKRLGTKNNRN